MTHAPPPLPPELQALGWGAFFADQITADEAGALPMRIATVHRARMSAMTPQGPRRLILPFHVNTADYAVGDWVLVQPETDTLLRLLDRNTLLERHTEGSPAAQLIAANIDTLFIVTSCNADFNPARLERYLAIANESGAAPVILLTKADQVDDAAPFQAQAAALQRGLTVLAVNARTASAADTLAPWCGPGQTVALIGSSGVGKSTLLNTLTGQSGDTAQQTGAIREDDAKGRHTTTARSLHPIAGGGCVIDTPGMRSLQVAHAAAGLELLFAEITELAPQCRFRNCTHAHEPGCAVRAAAADGRLDPARFQRWQKLNSENRDNTPPAGGPKAGKAAAGRGRKR